MDTSKTGVYCITNLLNNKFYIGSAASTGKYPSMSGFNLRWRIHKCLLNKNLHHNKHLQNSWNKYGESNFNFFIVEYCDPAECLDLEDVYISLANKSYLYNSNHKTSSLLGYKHSQESRNKMSIAKGGYYYLIDPEGVVQEGYNLLKFASISKVSPEGLNSLIKGKCSNYKGFTTSLENHVSYKILFKFRGLYIDKRKNRINLGWKIKGVRQRKIFKDLNTAINFRDNLCKQGYVFKVKAPKYTEDETVEDLVQKRKESFEKFNLKPKN